MNKHHVKIFKRKLLQNRLVLGTWITLPHSAIAEIFAKAGFDWVVVDLEHSSITCEKAEELVRTIESAQSIPLVRLTSNDTNQIKRVMDAGAHGIIVPNVKSAEDARNAVAATRYYPKGFRGVGLARAQGYGASFRDYLIWQNEGPIVIVQIEDQIALNHLDGIFKVPGITGFMIGPYDLSCSLGVPGQFSGKKFQVAEKKILDAGRKAGCPAGIHIVEPDPRRLRVAIRKGFHFIAYSVDIRMLDVAARLGLKAARK